MARRVLAASAWRMLPMCCRSLPSTTAPDSFATHLPRLRPRPPPPPPPATPPSSPLSTTSASTHPRPHRHPRSRLPPPPPTRDPTVIPALDYLRLHPPATPPSPRSTFVPDKFVVTTATPPSPHSASLRSPPPPATGTQGPMRSTLVPATFASTSPRCAITDRDLGVTAVDFALHQLRRHRRLPRRQRVLSIRRSPRPSSHRSRVIPAEEKGDVPQVFLYIDLFAGAGGLSLGLHHAGGRPKFAAERDRECVETYRLNFPEADIACRDVRDIQWDGVSADVVVGGPPCQGFSSLGHRRATTQEMTLRSRCFGVQRQSAPLHL